MRYMANNNLNGDRESEFAFVVRGFGHLLFNDKENLENNDTRT